MILGAANQTGEQSSNLARMAAVLSRLPIETTGTTVSRFCASGLQTIAMAAQQIDSGFTDIMMAGGVDRFRCGSVSPVRWNTIPGFRAKARHLYGNGPYR